jgi:hypothetical protein
MLPFRKNQSSQISGKEQAHKLPLSVYLSVILIYQHANDPADHPSHHSLKIIPADASLFRFVPVGDYRVEVGDGSIAVGLGCRDIILH